MNPGRELDALIAEKVMGTGWCQLMREGYAIRETGPKKCECGAIGFPYEHHAPYSTDIAAAWEVVEKLLKSDLQVKFVDYDSERSWMAGWDGFSFEYGSTAPHAICLAALKSIGHSF